MDAFSFSVLPLVLAGVRARAHVCSYLYGCVVVPAMKCLFCVDCRKENVSDLRQ